MFESKRQQELDAVHSVYDKNYFSIFNDLRPDFSVRRIKDNFLIGVEVTQLFYHEGSARLKMNSRYVEQVLAGNMHKADSGILWPDKVTISRESGTEATFDGVLYYNPDLYSYLSLVQERIEKKIRKYIGVILPCSKLELIIDDKENYFDALSITEFSTRIFKSTLLNLTIRNPVFDEIFYLGKVNGKYCHIPIKRSFFVSTLGLITQYFFVELIKTYKFREHFHFIILCIMRSIGFKDLDSFILLDDSIMVIYEGFLIRIDLKNQNLKSMTVPYGHVPKTRDQIGITIPNLAKYENLIPGYDNFASLNAIILDSMIFIQPTDHKMID